MANQISTSHTIREVDILFQLLQGFATLNTPPRFPDSFFPPAASRASLLNHVFSIAFQNSTDGQERRRIHQDKMQDGVIWRQLISQNAHQRRRILVRPLATPDLRKRVARQTKVCWLELKCFELTFELWLGVVVTRVVIPV